MHIPENYLAPAACAVMTAAMVPVWIHAVRKVNRELPKEKMPMLGIGAAFSFLAMMFNVPLIGGTTGHAVGGTLIALLFGPDAACIAVSIALLIQAVLFGDGGILAFGANCFNMAFILPYVGHGVYLIIMKLGKSRIRYFAAGAGAYVGINGAALCAAIEFGVQPLIFTDSAGIPLYCPYGLSISIPAMMISHLLIAGVVEAAFTVAVYAFIRKMAPELIYERAGRISAVKPTDYAHERQKNQAFEAEHNGQKDPALGAVSDRQNNLVPETVDSAIAGTDRKRFPIFALIGVLIVATPLGLLAAGTAWGEWGAEEISEVTSGGEALGYVPEGIASGWSLQVLMPDYSLEGAGAVWAYILSAVIGVALLVIIFKLISIPMKKRR